MTLLVHKRFALHVKFKNCAKLHMSYGPCSCGWIFKNHEYWIIIIVRPIIWLPIQIEMACKNYHKYRSLDCDHIFSEIKPHCVMKENGQIRYEWFFPPLNPGFYIIITIAVNKFRNCNHHQPLKCFQSSLWWFQNKLNDRLMQSHRSKINPSAGDSLIRWNCIDIAVKSEISCFGP